MPLELSTFPFTPNDDAAVVNETVDIDGSAGLVAAITNDNPSDALEGDDTISGSLSGEVLASRSDVAGIAYSSDILTGEGEDEVFGSVDYDSFDLSEFNLFAGILGNFAPPATPQDDLLATSSLISGYPVIDTGDGDDSVIGQAARDGEVTRNAFGILGAAISAGEGNDTVTGSLSIVSPADASSTTSEGNAGIFASHVETGGGEDKVTGSVVASMGTLGAFFSLSGIRDSTIVTGDRRDSVEGTVDLTAGNDVLSFSISGIDTASTRFAQATSGSAIVTGEGKDDVLGEVTLDFGDFGSFEDVSGISNSSVSLPNSRPTDLASTNTALNEEIGLPLSGIHTGSEADTVVGKVAGTAGYSRGAFSVAGIDNGSSGFDIRQAASTADDFGFGGGTINTGDGKDRVHGSVDLEFGDEADFEDVSGIANQSLDFDIFEPRLALTANLVEENADHYPAAIDTGAQADDVIGSVKLSGGVESFAGDIFGINNGSDFVDIDPNPEFAPLGAAQTGLGGPHIPGGIDTGDGNDKVIGSVDIEFGDDAEVEFVAGIYNEGVGLSDVVVESAPNVAALNGVGDAPGIATGSGRDTVEGTVSVKVGSDSEVDPIGGIVGGGIDTGEGNDKVKGTAEVSASDDLEAAFAYGITETSICTGDGRDTVEGKATIEASDLDYGEAIGISYADISTGADDDEVIGEGDTVGISESLVSLGSGNDEVTARGGETAVEYSSFFGDEGDDVFDLHSGFGVQVDGGDDDDLLILAGNKDDFDFYEAGPNGVIIEGATAEFEVYNVEQFQFDDGTCDYDDLNLLSPIV